MDFDGELWFLASSRLYLVIHQASTKRNYIKAQQYKVFTMVQFWNGCFEASGFQKQLPANKLYSLLPHFCLSSFLTYSHSPCLIHPHSSTSNINMALTLSSLLISVCYSVSFLYYSLYRSVPLPLCLLLSLSNWYGTSWSSDIAVTFCLCASYRQCTLSYCFSSIHWLQVCVCAVSFRLQLCT